MTRLLVASGNAHKVEEIRTMLLPLGMEVIDLSAFGDAPDVEETGETFEANAELKAQAAQNLSDDWVLADDSGLAVDALRELQEITVKSLGNYMGDVKGIAGVSILGDGEVVLILDVPTLISTSITKSGLTAENKH